MVAEAERRVRDQRRSRAVAARNGAGSVRSHAPGTTNPAQGRVDRDRPLWTAETAPSDDRRARFPRRHADGVACAEFGPRAAARPARPAAGEIAGDADHSTTTLEETGDAVDALTHL